MQTSEPTRPTPAEDTPVAGATLLAEAPTAEAALEEVHATYGPNARIVAAKRVLRGGIGGFFAKEVVQIHAAAADTAPATAAPATAAPAAATPAAAAPASAAASAYGMPTATAEAAASDSPIDRLLADARETTDEVDFATYLRQQLTLEPTGVRATGSRAPSTPAPAPAAAPGHRAEAGFRAEPNPRSEPAPMHWPSMDDLGRPAWADAPAGSTVSGTGPGGEAVEAARMSAEADRIAARITAGRVAQPASGAAAAVDAENDAPGSWGPQGDADDLLEGRAWSRTNLVRLGLPVSFVESLDVAGRSDDLAWTFALAEALRPLCRPLPTGRALMVGPRARSLATAIGMPVTAIGQPLLALGDVAAGVTGSETSLQWMERARRGRWLHLVAGGKGWRDLLHADPLAVSWASEEHLPEALRAALELGLVLGYGPVGGTAGRAQPLDVALAIRDLVPVR